MTTNPLHLLGAGCTALATSIVAFFIVLGIAEERANQRARKEAGL